MTGMTARSQDCINNNDNGGIVTMKTLSDVAKAVLNMETEMEYRDKQKSVSVGFEVGEEMFDYGITIRDILDCSILAVGLWTRGIIHTINWDTYCGCNDKSEERLIEFLSKCLEQDGIPVDSKICWIEIVDY